MSGEFVSSKIFVKTNLLEAVIISGQKIFGNQQIQTGIHKSFSTIHTTAHHRHQPEVILVVKVKPLGHPDGLVDVRDAGLDVVSLHELNDLSGDLGKDILRAKQKQFQLNHQIWECL